MKNPWHNRRYSMIFALLTVTSVSAIAWLLHEFIYSENQLIFTLEERTAFVSLWVSTIGFALAVTGAWIAVLQFQAAQRKPDLYLWMEDRRRERTTLHPGKRSFELVLENRGRGVGRYIEAKLDFEIPHIATRSGSLTRVTMVRDTSGHREDHWRLLRTSASTSAVFIGRDEYVCYDEDWDTLGVFQINWHDAEPLHPQYLVQYELRCEGMARRAGTLTIKFSTE